MASWFAIIFSSLFLSLSIKKVLLNNFSTMHLASVIFFLMQVVPLLVELYCGYDDQMFLYKNMYFASIDTNVHLIYCAFVSVSMMLFYFLGNCLKEKSVAYSHFDCHTKDIHFVIFFLLLIGIFSPFFSIIFAPDPSVYLTLGRFYKLNIGKMDLSFLYHEAVVKQIVYVSFLSTVLLYFFNDKKNILYNFIVFLGVIIVTWFEGKRAFLFFILFSITAIDVVQNRYRHDKLFFIIKSAFFVAVALIFFLVYKEYTGKSADSDFLPQYNVYYSRMSCVKTAIYSAYYGKPVLQYPGQSFLYDLFFFVPRQFWPDKPAMFVKYFTAFALNRNNVDFLSWNFITNMWCEYISNIGAWGYVAGMSLVFLISKITDFTTSIFVRMWGIIFVLLYFMFGFEYLVLIVYLLFLSSLIIQKVKDHY